MAQMSENEEKNWAMGAHLSVFVLGFLGPLIIFFIKKDESELVRAQSLEALNFQISVFIAAIICIPLVFILIGFFLLMAVAIGSIVYTILAAIAVNKGEDYRYPYTLRLIK